MDGKEDGGLDFIREIVAADVKAGNNSGGVITRWPPEPNGYMHIGHAKAFLLDFDVAAEHGGHCNLRFDDTNPEKEETEFVEAIKQDLQWMGCDWGEREYYASDYYAQLYEWAVDLVKNGKAYVDHLSQEEMRRYRGTPTEPGRNSPHRDRSVEENLALLEQMKAGRLEEGACVLRAKIDMAHPNLIMRDPTIYRIKQAHHHRTGDDWAIYPMYDFAHCLSDAIEGVTHSLCDVGFINNRELYDWFIDNTPVPSKPHQYEFARFNLTYTVMSKRLLRPLVEEGYVNGWDDPRMPTLRGLRRRGYTASALRTFVKGVGVARVPSTIDFRNMAFHIREELNKTAPRVMAVLNPLKVTIDNYPENEVEEFDAENNPEDANAGSRRIPFSREIYIERDDFREDPPRKWFRFAPGREVRLKHAYYVTCTDVVKNQDGEVVELHCTYDPASRGGWSDDGRKVRGTSHWVSAAHAHPAEVRLYDHLFLKEDPAEIEKAEHVADTLNPESLNVLKDCLVEPSLVGAKPGTRYQFLRQGYFCVDPDSTPDLPVFNRTVGLRDSWARTEKKNI